MNENLSTLAKRVRFARDKRGLTQAQLAKAIGADQSVIGNLERRDGRTSKYSEKIARVLKVNLNWLLTGMGNSELESNGGRKLDDSSMVVVGGFDAWNEETPLGSDEVALPYYRDVKLSAGNGHLADGLPATDLKLRFSERTLKDVNVAPKNAIAMKVDGDSMERLIIDGATVGVDTSKALEPIKDNKIYALETDGFLRCKYLQKMAGNRIRVFSENPAYADEIYTMEDFSQYYRIVGWVFWWSRLERW